jgi:acyl carrier protein
VWDEQFELLLRKYLPFLPADAELPPDLGLREYGLDSLGVVDLLMAVESGYDIRLGEDALSLDTFATPAALWYVLSRTREAALLSVGPLACE